MQFSFHGICFKNAQHRCLFLIYEHQLKGLMLSTRRRHAVLSSQYSTRWYIASIYNKNTCIHIHATRWIQDLFSVHWTLKISFIMSRCCFSHGAISFSLPFLLFIFIHSLCFLFLSLSLFFSFGLSSLSFALFNIVVPCFYDLWNFYNPRDIHTFFPPHFAIGTNRTKTGRASKKNRESTRAEQRL